MALLSNSAVVSSYTFPVGPSTSGSATSNTATVDIDITNATVTFTKENHQNYILPGSTTTLSYNITNLNVEPITHITIQDPLFTTKDVKVDQIVGGTISGDILTITLNPAGLLTNETAQATLTLSIAGTAHPDSILYDTTATGSFTIATTPENTLSKTSKGHLEVNAAVVTITKSVFPNVSSVTSGNLLTYTLVFTNSGNVDATIPIGQFTDTWKSGLLTNVKSLNSKFSVVGNSITNTLTLSLPANTTATLIYTGIAMASA